ncbi:MAG: GDSL-type esterase/lipase family protein [Actinobacteria bacterium]|nr:GDSL-type esterase/lipase family protein [Actinomycetota bacterium]
MESSPQNDDIKKAGARKNKKLWILIPVFIVVFLLIAAAGAYFYFIYYLKPNFEAGELNNISNNAAEKVIPDSVITYTINFKNSGNVVANDFKVLTGIPSNTVFMSSDPVCKFNQADGSMEFNAGNLLKGQSGKVVFSVKVNKPVDNGTLIKGRQTVFKFISRGKEENFIVTKTLENKVESSPDFKKFNIEVTDKNGGDFNMGDLVTFMITIENTGNMNAENIIISDNIPAKLEVIKDSINPSGAESQYDAANNKITWNLEELTINKPVVLSFDARIGNNFADLEKFKNTATLEYEKNIKGEIFVEKEVHAFPDFSKSAGTVIDVDGGSIWAGDILQYTIIVKNTGLREGRDFELHCPIPAGTSYIKNSASSADMLANIKTDEIQWNIRSLGVGTEQTFTFKVSINDSLKRGGVVNTGFFITGDSQYVKMEPLPTNIRPFIFQTVVCMGDSHIPHTNWPSVLNHLLNYKYPHAEFRTIGSGVPQEMAYQGVRRFDSTVGVYRPQIIVIGYGTNDVGSGTDLLRSGLDDLIKKAKAMGATVLIHSIGYIDTVKNPDKASYLVYNNVIRDVCASNGVPYIDLYGPMSQDPGKYLDTDGMHWTPEGGSLLAHLVFNTLVNYLDANGQRK